MLVDFVARLGLYAFRPAWCYTDKGLVSQLCPPHLCCAMCLGAGSRFLLPAPEAPLCPCPLHLVIPSVGGDKHGHTVHIDIDIPAATLPR